GALHVLRRRLADYDRRRGTRGQLAVDPRTLTAGSKRSARLGWGRPVVSAPSSRRVLVLAMGALGERLAGPEIRALEFAKALSSEYEVTLAAERPGDGECEGIAVVPSTRRRLTREAAEHDVVISACLPPY